MMPKMRSTHAFTQHKLADSFLVCTLMPSLSRDARGTPFVALRSAIQRHRFNQPYQLGTGSGDTADDAQPFLFYVRSVPSFVDMRSSSRRSE